MLLNVSQFVNIYSRHILPPIVPVTILIVCRDLVIEHIISFISTIIPGADKMAPKSLIFIHVLSVVGTRSGVTFSETYTNC